MSVMADDDERYTRIMSLAIRYSEVLIPVNACNVTIAIQHAKIYCHTSIKELHVVISVFKNISSKHIHSFPSLIKSLGLINY